MKVVFYVERPRAALWSFRRLGSHFCEICRKAVEKLFIGYKKTGEGNCLRPFCELMPL